MQVTEEMVWAETLCLNSPLGLSVGAAEKAEGAWAGKGSRAPDMAVELVTHPFMFVQLSWVLETGRG